MFEKYNKIIIAVIVIIILFGLYVKFLKPSDDNNLLTSTGSVSSQNSADLLGADIIRAINQINALELDINIFNDPILLRLVDRSHRIDPQPVGRNNPFAPLGEDKDVDNSTAEDDEDNEAESGE